MEKIIRIGTRESQLALWQATEVKRLLAEAGHAAELIPVKSEGDIDLQTPLYAMGVQGVFTRSLDTALLNNRIDIAVHSMKDVPVQLPQGIAQAAVLARGPVDDLLVLRDGKTFLDDEQGRGLIATSSIRRKAQWLGKYPNHEVENLRGNVNTRLSKLARSSWDGAIFALAGLERIDLRPKNSLVLDWMLPAPAQGAIMVVCRNDDHRSLEACANFNDATTALCTHIERQFLHLLMGGCSTPISALAKIRSGTVYFKGNICSLNGALRLEIERTAPLAQAENLGELAAKALLEQGADKILDQIQHVGKS